MANFNTSLAILCGGQARRLGCDKGLYCPLADESLVVRALRRFAGLFDDFMIVVRDDEQAQSYLTHIESAAPELRGAYRIVTDQTGGNNTFGNGFTFEGALRGVMTALHSAIHGKVVVLPVDQVAVNARHLTHLAKQPGAAYFCREQDGVWPFPSQWLKSDEPQVFARAQAGAYSVAGCLSELAATRLAMPQFHAALAINANTEDEMRAFFGRPLVDPYQRRMHYLRFSLIESCNMSCHYCLPEGFPEWYRHKARLSGPDIDTLLAGFRRLGFRKVRFTGGEPTLHPACLTSIKKAADLGYEEICLTTNGTQLTELDHWIDAGLTGLNISLDSIRPDTFRRMTKSNQLEQILATIEAASQSGIDLKINTVLLRSINGNEIGELIDWALSRPLTLRFIELMPTKLNRTFENEERVHGHEIEPLLLARGLTDKIAPEDPRGRSTRGPATVYQSSRYLGRVGLINPLSCNFCSACNRLRLGARGGVRLCLFADQDIEVPKDSPMAVEAFMRQLIEHKEERHHLEDGDVGNVSTFRTIGG